MAELIKLADELANWGKFYTFYTLVNDLLKIKNDINDEIDALPLSMRSFDISCTQYIIYIKELLTDLISSYDPNSFTQDQLLIITDKVIYPFLAYYRRMNGYPETKDDNGSIMQYHLLEIYNKYIDPLYIKDLYDELNDDDKLGIVRLFIIDLAIEFITIMLGNEKEILRILKLVVNEKNKRIYLAKSILENNQSQTLKNIHYLYKYSVCEIFKKHITKEIENLGKVFEKNKNKNEKKILIEKLEKYNKVINEFTNNLY